MSARRIHQELTESEYMWFYYNYPITSSAYVAQYLGRDIKFIYRFAAKCGLKKEPKFLSTESSGRFQKMTQAGKNFQFKKGHIPQNKGKKMTPETYNKVKDTMFKKGGKPTNTLYDGAVTLRGKSTGERYQYIRIRDSKWVLLHRFIYEDYWGPIPEGYVVRFRDGNSMNTVIDNLVLMPRTKNMLMNTVHRFPKELIKLIKTNAKLKRQITNHGNQKQN